MTTYVYRLPDGSRDRPNENGNHTATVSVMHSAESFARFPSCPSCRHLAETSCPVCYQMLATSVFGGFDPVTETFASVERHSPDGCGNADCELCAKYAAGWCQRCKQFTRAPKEVPAT